VDEVELPPAAAERRWTALLEQGWEWRGPAVRVLLADLNSKSARVAVPADFPAEPDSETGSRDVAADPGQPAGSDCQYSSPGRVCVPTGSRAAQES
jgi:hypothetical protein